MRFRKLAMPLLLAAALLSGCGQSTDTDSSLMSTATLMAMQAVGMSVMQPLPVEGCSGSAIPPEKVMDLLNAIPEQQKFLLAQILDASAVAWTVQLYAGELGLGLCFPVQNTLILIPGDWAGTAGTRAAPA